MIRYALQCERGHAFESWFQDSASFDKQAKRGLVSCPVCDSVTVEKSIMAPQIPRKGRTTEQRVGEEKTMRATARRKKAGAGGRASRQAERAARSHQGQRRQCGRAVPRTGPQDALRRDRAPADLRRRVAGRGKGADRRRRRGAADASAAGRQELIQEPSLHATVTFEACDQPDFLLSQVRRPGRGRT
jgi:hypothetical protein